MRFVTVKSITDIKNDSEADKKNGSDIKDEGSSEDSEPNTQSSEIAT